MGTVRTSWRMRKSKRPPAESQIRAVQFYSGRSVKPMPLSPGIPVAVTPTRMQQQQTQQRLNHLPGTTAISPTNTPTRTMIRAVTTRITAGHGGADENGFEIVKQPKITKRKALSPEELALGEEMVKSKKTKRDIMDAGWNRFMFDDSNLPDWFEKEEDLHMKRRPDVDPDVVDKYRDRGKEINVKTIKKVVEAKARRKRRMTKSMDKAKKKAAALLENDDVGSREKTKEIAKMYKAARAEGKLKDVAYVVAKKHRAGKRAQRPSGVKGPFKQVDPRMKSDNRTKRTNATKKKGKKRTLKGKQAKPTKQFNTNR